MFGLDPVDSKAKKWVFLRRKDRNIMGLSGSDPAATAANKIKRKLRVLVISNQDFEKDSKIYLKRPHWRVI